MPASTTVPSAHTEQDKQTLKSTIIRWCFPRALETRLSARVVVGRDEHCDVVLTGDEVSRRHAEFRIDGPIIAVRDLESRNGVHVNGTKASDGPLATGDVVRCGEWVGLVASIE